MYRDLIAVTNRHLCSRPFTEQITRVCKLHPKALILREKDLPEEEYFSLARQVKEICEQFKVPFIPHFYPAVARELGCDRLHLPLPLLLENPKVVSDFHTVGTSSILFLKQSKRKSWELPISQQDIFMLPTARKGSRHGDFHFCRTYAKLCRFRFLALAESKLMKHNCTN